MDHKHKILFVDDESVICTMAADFLELHGFEVETYEDSSEALSAFSSDPSDYDIVITDQTMPGLSGCELLERIKGIRGDIPQILCTGYSENLGCLNKKDSHIDAFFMKPYRFDELIGQIEKLV